MAIGTDIDQISVPLDVIKFAESQGVLEYVRPVVEHAIAVFPDRLIRVYLEHDPETDNDSRIVVDLNVSEWNADQRFEARQRYKANLFNVCPIGRYAGVFVFRMSI